MKTIAVIGSGTMGNGIAHVFAQHDYTVHLIDINKEALNNALNIISKNLDRQVKKEIIDATKKENSLKNISTYTALHEGVKNTDLVIEAATENITTKLDIFRQIDEATARNTILASNTSSISITKLASVTSKPERVIGMHFMNPVPIMKLVEIIRGYSTSDEVAFEIVNLAKNLGKVPVEANDYPGFVSNRILMPMINEAIYTLWQGVAGVKEIDTVMKLGMAHPMGPLRLADFVGLDVCLFILNVLYEGFGNDKYAPCPLLVNMVNAGKLGNKTSEGFYDYSTDPKDPEVARQFLTMTTASAMM